MTCTLRFIGACVLLAMATMAGGCQLLGYAAANTLPDPDKASVPRYKGLNNEVCCVMVWADFNARKNFPPIRNDLATTIQMRLVDEGLIKLKSDELEKAMFPYPANSVVLFQDQHPEIMQMPITEAVLRLGIITKDDKSQDRVLSRVIYVELEEFETRMPQAQQLFRGYGKANVRVVEISGDVAKVVFESPIEARFPASGPEGLPPSDSVNDRAMYQGTVTELARAVAMRFYSVPD